MRREAQECPELTCGKTVLGLPVIANLNAGRAIFRHALSRDIDNLKGQSPQIQDHHQQISL